MDRLVKSFIVYLKLITFLSTVNTETYTVKVSTDSHINVVDSRFLSFTIDPEYLFTSNEKYNSKECICMASALTPAFIRIAGPSTSHLTFKNTSITITPEPTPETREASHHPPLFNKLNLGDFISNRASNSANLVKRATSLSVTHSQWKKFLEWSNQTGFDIVFALNNQEKMTSGVWNPNSAMSILSVAEKAIVGDVVWQLGYECSNQSIDEYLYDLETLRLMVDSFPQGASRQWRVVAGDASPCLQEDSKSDFKDFVTLSNERLDAILLDGKSSTRELEKLSNKDREKLVRVLLYSETPLWITEGQLKTDQVDYQEQLRAADWLKSLGQSARNGFAVHFRELKEDELFQPSLSFYMALLFKNLVGERVLNAELDAPSEQTYLFAHCTSLRHKSIPGAVTLFAANMDDETARFSLKLSRREDGGDIMQFILGLDAEGNIMVNGRAMYYEGNIRPVVKRVRPYKTLLISLPPKSFGFWVLANTKIDACYDIKSSEKAEIPVAEDKFEEHNLVRTRRSSDLEKSELEYPDFVDLSEEQLELNSREGHKDSKIKRALNDRVKNLNRDFKKIRGLLKRTERTSDNDIFISDKVHTGIIKRQIDDSFQGEKIQDKIKKILHRDIQDRKPFILKSMDKNFFRTSLINDESKPKEGILVKIIRLNAKLNETRQLRNERARKLNLKLPALKNKVDDRNSENPKPKKILQDIDRKKNKVNVDKRTRDLFKRHSKIEEDNSKQETVENETNSLNKIDFEKNPNSTEKNTIYFTKRHLNNKTIEQDENKINNKAENNSNEPIKSRKRRSILNKNKSQENSEENEIDTEGFKKFGKILHKINEQLDQLPDKLKSNDEVDDENDSEAFEEQIILKTKLSDNDSTIKLSEKSNIGILKATFTKALSVLEDMNTKLSRVISAVTILN